MSTGKKPLRSPEVSYKIVHRIYPVKQLIAKFCKDNDLKCVFCKEENESIVHLFYDSIYTKIFWCDFFFFC